VVIAPAALVAVLATSIAASGPPAFEGSSEPIAGKVRERMVGSSWHRGCPVALDDLRLLRVTYWGFDDRAHNGRLVINAEYDDELIAVMKRLYKLRYPIRRMQLVDQYNASDDRSMAADNTSAFNCRFVAGTTRWSLHAYGYAIDINPIENPYVSGSHVSPPEGRPYADRSRHARGMIHAGDDVFKAFAKKAGWEWLGDGPQSIRDYQHFSSTGD
jgi:poly-gamma-glutamate synthesis protein (capsule biosynthesis protein)